MIDDLSQWAARWSIPPAAMREFSNLFTRLPDVPQGGSESRVQSELRLITQQLNAPLWRNNNGACKDDTGRLIRYGLGHDSKALSEVWKSSDLIGITPITITARHVGYQIGVFTAVEVKKPGWKKPSNAHERAQEAFLASVKSFGGLAMFATEAKTFKDMVEQWRNV